MIWCAHDQFSHFCIFGDLQAQHFGVLCMCANAYRMFARDS